MKLGGGYILVFQSYLSLGFMPSPKKDDDKEKKK